MKRLALVAIVLLGTGFAAYADVAHYTNLLKQPRGDAELNVDMDYCAQRVGPDPRGVPTPPAYKSCMRSRGWRWNSKQIDWTWIDPETGLTCHAILGGAGQECSNY